MTLRRSVPHLLALFLYSCLTLIMTYPAVLRLKSAIIGDYVDSFLNTWIIAWGIRKITRGEWSSLFDANIFFPYKNTLAYSEHLLGVALTAIPIQLGFDDPLVTFNVSVLISFVLTAMGMYLLVWYLTGNGYAAFFSGLLFSFFPWRMAHIAHLQLLSAQWLPLTFLFLHKSTKTFSYGSLLGAALFFILQFYSCGYYGLFLALFVVVFMILTLREAETGRYRLLGRFGLFFLISFPMILPAYLPYWKLKKDFGFFRPFGEVLFFSADFASFLSTPIQNQLWGSLLAGFEKPEGDLFMGLIAGAMSLIGVWSLVQWKKIGVPLPRFSASEPRFYFYLLVLSFLLTLGPVIHWQGRAIGYGPYLLLYQWVPGFEGLRVPARFVVMMHLAVSVLAGYGLAWVLGRIPSSWKRRAVGSGFALLALIEYASFPISMPSVPSGKEFPQVYAWLAKQPGDFPILEMPLPSRAEEVRQDAAYVYFSTYHWKKLVNGYSGFIPPGYTRLYQEELSGFPSEETLERIQELGVRYVIIHLTHYPQPEREKIISLFAGKPQRFTLEKRIDGTLVYRLLQS